MKLVRVFLIGVGVLAALVLLALGVALNSSFQTWAARRALATQPALNASVGNVSVGLGRIEMRGVRAESDGAVLTLPGLETDVPLLAAGLSQQVGVTRLVAKGWTLDLTRVPALQGTAAAASPAEAVVASQASTIAAFRGALAQVLLPIDLAVDGVDLEGEILLPAQREQPPGRVQVAIKGGGIAAGREGNFTFSLSGADGAGATIELKSTLTAGMDTPRTFNRLSAQADATVKGPQFPAGVKLSIASTAARAAAGEDYTLSVVSETKPLVSLQASYTAAGARIAGTWKLDVRHTDLAPFTLGRPLPVFAAAGGGTFETDATFAELHAVGRLDASADQLSVIAPELAAMGGITLVADFDVLQHGDALRVERLTAEVSGAKPVVSIRALQSFEFNLATAALKVADPAQDLVGVSLHGLPLAWARPLLAGFVVTGGDVRGEFAASAREGGLSLRARTPLTVAGLSVAQAGKVLVQALDLSLNASADYTPQGWQAQIAELSVRSGGQRLLSLDVKAGQLNGANEPLKAAGHWSASLPGLLAQPVAAGSAQLTSGVAQADFTASVDRVVSLQTKLALTNLVAANKETLPAITADVHAEIAADGKITFSVPFLFELGARKSDLALAGSIQPGQDALAVEVRVTSENLFVEDLQILAAPLASAPPPPAAPNGPKPAATAVASGAAPTVQPDALPVWQGITGELTLALKKVVYGTTLTITDMGGVLKLDPDCVKLDNFRALLDAQSDLKLSGGLTFVPGAKEPYLFASDLALNNFDTGSAFRALDPVKLPTLDARLSVATKLTSSGPNLASLADKMHGDVNVSAKSGVFRAFSGLAVAADRVTKTQSTVAALGGLIGSMTGRGKEAGDYANRAQIVTNAAKMLAEIQFDQLSLKASRDQKNNLQLTDFTLISPLLRLTGGGTVHYVEGKSLLAQPMDLTFNAGANGQLADLLNRIDFLDTAQQDNLGYTAFKSPLKVGGSMANSSSDDFLKMLVEAAVEKSGLLNGLLGK